VSVTVAVAASIEQTWRALLLVLEMDADRSRASAELEAMAGQVRGALPGGLILHTRFGAPACEVWAHLSPRGARCDLTVDATQDAVPVIGRGWWNGQLSRRRIRRVLRAGGRCDLGR